MKLLWVKGDFLHPTNKGGQIRTLETLKRLHARHEVHYVGLNYPPHPEALARAGEYCSYVYPIEHAVAEKRTLGFGMELVHGLFDNWPVSIRRFRSAPMERRIAELTRTEGFDAIVCDFLNSTQNMPDLASSVLFQHNVEGVIWKRHVEQARNPLARIYLESQARRMFDYERDACRRARSVIAVSQSDAGIMQKDYGVERVAAVPTGVDIEYFSPLPSTPVADLVFVGSMDWMPNIDGMKWFITEILPRIRKRRPGCSLAIAGRKPSPEIVNLAAAGSGIQVTGTVPDVRPYLWGSAVSIVPLRVGGGTRLKIYEAMAARVPVVSTSIGAEGLDVEHGGNILIADQPAEFAERCVELLADSALRTRISESAFELVQTRYSWEVICGKFEELLQQ